MRIQYHESLPKNERPLESTVYRWYLNDRYVYTASVVRLRGTCWATVRIIEPSPEFRELYQVGTELDIKIAYYRFEPLNT